MSASREWTGYILSKIADPCRKLRGGFADTTSQGNPAQWNREELGLNLANSSYVDNQSELF